MVFPSRSFQESSWILCVAPLSTLYPSNSSWFFNIFQSISLFSLVQCTIITQQGQSPKWSPSSYTFLLKIHSPWSSQSDLLKLQIQIMSSHVSLSLSHTHTLKFFNGCPLFLVKIKTITMANRSSVIWSLLNSPTLFHALSHLQSSHSGLSSIPLHLFLTQGLLSF